MKGEQAVWKTVMMGRTALTVGVFARTRSRQVWLYAIGRQVMQCKLHIVADTRSHHIGERDMSAPILLDVDSAVLLIEKTLDQNSIEIFKHGHTSSVVRFYP